MFLLSIFFSFSDFQRSIEQYRDIQNTYRYINTTSIVISLCQEQRAVVRFWFLNKNTPFQTYASWLCIAPICCLEKRE